MFNRSKTKTDVNPVFVNPEYSLIECTVVEFKQNNTYNMLIKNETYEPLVNIKLSKERCKNKVPYLVYNLQHDKKYFAVIEVYHDAINKSEILEKEIFLKLSDPNQLQLRIKNLKIDHSLISFEFQNNGLSKKFIYWIDEMDNYYYQHLKQQPRTVSLRNLKSNTNYVIGGRNNSETVLVFQVSTFKSPAQLKNMNENCYLNSALQGLTSCPGFIEDIKTLKQETIENINESSKLNVLVKLVECLNESNRDLDITKDKTFLNWNKFGQQDSYELICHILTEVYNDIRRSMEENGKINKGDLNKWFDLVLPLRLIIKHQFLVSCEHDSIKSYYDCDFALRLHFPDPDKHKEIRIQNMIEDYFTANIIEDYVCNEENNCKVTDAAKLIRKLVRPLPRNICIHLQRNCYKEGSLSKIFTRVIFEQTLTIKTSYVTVRDTIDDTQPVIEGDSSTEEKLNDELKETIGVEQLCHEIHEKKEESEFKIVDEQLENINSSSSTYDDVEYIYELMGVLVHLGDLNWGHYVCYKKIHDNWFLTNDSTVDHVDVTEVLDCNPYVLFYELKEMK